MVVGLAFRSAFQNGDGAMADVIVESFDRTAEDTILFFPRALLTQHSFEGSN